MELSVDNVTATMRFCLTDSGTLVKGVIHSFILDPAAVATAKPDIADMLSQLPDAFMASKGGGASFLQMCYRSDGELWTGMHLTMESLVVLGIAAGIVSFNLPRELDEALPGGMPYLVVDDKVDA